jgi:hypothetical protein
MLYQRSKKKKMALDTSVNLLGYDEDDESNVETEMLSHKNNKI